MREIMFRGQTRRYGEKVRMGDGKKLPSQWVYGGIFAGTGDFSVIYGAKTEEFTGAAIEKHTVYSDTVGQYTGLKDKNGKRIFDGDILHYVYEPGKGFWNANQLSVIKYGKTGYKFEGIMGTNKYALACGCLSSIPFNQDAENIPNFEVIGNIHDNPELLEVR